MRMRLIAAAAATALLGALLVPGGAQADLLSSAPAATPDATECTLNPALPKRQLRAMWIASVVNIDWPSAPARPRRSSRRSTAAGSTSPSGSTTTPSWCRSAPPRTRSGPRRTSPGRSG
ncbi:hypothetical protein ACFQZ4_22050 [Catellatospora coxensis]